MFGLKYSGVLFFGNKILCNRKQKHGNVFLTGLFGVDKHKLFAFFVKKRIKRFAISKNVCIFAPILRG